MKIVRVTKYTFQESLLTFHLIFTLLFRISEPSLKNFQNFRETTTFIWGRNKNYGKSFPYTYLLPIQLSFYSLLFIYFKEVCTYLGGFDLF